MMPSVLLQDTSAATAVGTQFDLQDRFSQTRPHTAPQQPPAAITSNTAPTTSQQQQIATPNMHALLRDLMRLAEQPAEPAVPDDATAGNDGQLIASQAAALAAARQAMQLMLQLLEQSGFSMEDVAAGAQAATQAANADMQAVSAQSLQHALQQAAPQATSFSSEHAEVDSSEVIAAQVAELASARQAMQLLAQLLESAGPGATTVESSARAAAQPGQALPAMQVCA